MWTNDTVQFARLIAELEAAGAFADARITATLSASMDLAIDDVIDLKTRAVRLWEDAKSIGHAMGTEMWESLYPRQLITRAQAESWVGRPLSDGEMDRLDDAIPNSSIPDAVGAIVDAFDDNE
ncbi:hypothetical protein [Nocardia sp. alder85J]|uniref:hypothetical protein n=1 Tax=Nocardia sp. alder85J TaxID=2862949 RepID=UPI001CD3851D|nr:hypothetical protein [Nocardia sp. alder85J]MCX4094516.1 hypothetical protein [Nocardia sp. alder85J]